MEVLIYERSLDVTNLCVALKPQPDPYIGCPCPCPPIRMGFGWAWMRCYCSWVGIGFVHPCMMHPTPNWSQTFGCREYANQETLRVEASDSERPFICPIQPRLGVGG